MEVGGIQITRNTSKPAQTVLKKTFFLGGGSDCRMEEGGIKTEIQ